MALTLFSRESRVLLCNNCGAPLDVHVEGGEVRCQYCGTVTRFATRNEQQDAAERRAGEALRISETTRIEVLRAQDHRQLVLPASLAPLVAAGEIPAARVRPALAQWVASRRRVQEGDPLNESEQLFHLTLLLAPKLEARHERALVENALEALSDKRHRQVLRCLLAERAVLAGDCRAAAEWLEPCNQRSTDLHADSAFRLATCFLATARSDFKLVLALLGNRFDDVPIVDGRDLEAAILRANALERSGQLDSAQQQVLAVVQRDVRCLAELRDLAARLRVLSLCPRSVGELYEPLLEFIAETLRPQQPRAGCALAGMVVPGALAVVFFFLWGAQLSDRHPSTFFFWAGAGAAGVTLVAAVVGRWVQSKVRFGREATLGFARLAFPGIPEDGSCTLCVDLLTPSGPVPNHKTLLRETPVPPGLYPCLMDASGRHFEICVETPPLNWMALASDQPHFQGTASGSAPFAP